ncbi:hypothetical protein JW872_03910 [Candidatus Babeliales bacterium]|nr:hypothetical protein [Candidatus Babeliales bacterium]
MKQLLSEKYTVAWFKLAEFVSRGEKERALAMYRLLAHSLDDKAFVEQLQGDILLSFQDVTAFDHYVDAALLYQKQGRMNEAIAVYEHLVMLEPVDKEAVERMLEIYSAGQNEPRLIHATERLMRLLMENHHFELVSWLLQKVDGTDSVSKFSTVHQELIQNWSKEKPGITSVLMVHVTKLIDTYLLAKQQRLLQTFLTMLEMVNKPLYTEAFNYMHQGNVAL